MVNYKKQNKWKIGYFLLLGNFIFLFAVIGFEFYTSYEFDYNTKIDFVGLNDTEIRNIENILFDVKPYFLNRTRSIKFVNESYEVNFGDAGLSAFSKDDLRGVNLNRKIVVYYSNNERYLKAVICHELLHNWINEETPAYDLMYKEICYR